MACDSGIRGVGSGHYSRWSESEVGGTGGSSCAGHRRDLFYLMRTRIKCIVVLLQGSLFRPTSVLLGFLYGWTGVRVECVLRRLVGQKQQTNKKL